MYLIAVPFEIGISYLFYIIYLYKAFWYRGVPSEKIQYYITAHIPLATAVTHSMALILYHEPIPSPEFLTFFFIEWMITTPLLVINIGRILHIKLYKYFLLSAAAIAMNFCGFLAHTFSKPMAYLPFAIGGVAYLSLVSYLLLIYRRRLLLIENQSPRTPVLLSVARMLLCGLVSLWSVYPICYILYMLDLLTVDVTITLFVILDILSKGTFSLTMLRYYDYMNRHDMLIQFLTQSRQQSPSIQPTRIQPETISVQQRPPSISLITIEDI